MSMHPTCRQCMITTINVMTQEHEIIWYSLKKLQKNLKIICIIEWVWVNQNGPNTKMVDFNPAQNGGKNFFPCNAATYDSSLKQGYCMPNNALCHFVLQDRWMVLFFFLHFGKNGEFFDETVFSKPCLLAQHCV